jgi:hypothetical protein
MLQSPVVWRISLPLSTRYFKRVLGRQATIAGPRRDGGIALSLGERVDRDGAFTSRRGPGEGLLPLPSNAVVPG